MSLLQKMCTLSTFFLKSAMLTLLFLKVLLQKLDIHCVTDILFRIEATLLLDHTQQECTSKLSRCNIPFHKKHTEPKEVYIFTFAKEKNVQTI